MALIRYPGSKAKIASQIVAKFPSYMAGELFHAGDPPEYREPFFGAGAVGFECLQGISRKCRVRLNDIDPHMQALWMTVAFNPWELCNLIDKVKPSANLFYELKEEDGRSDLPMAEKAVRKLALHRLSYSGLGAMSGGPLGGKDQSSEYNVDCRWNPPTMKAEIRKLHRCLARFEDLEISSEDCGKLIDNAGERCCIYLDPPYYEKGPQLYRYSMDEEDHRVLAIKLRSCRADWVLSYDDHPEIRRLYSWARIEPITFTYVMARAKGATRPKNQEVIITPQ